MTAVRVMIAGRDYDIACDDGQEPHLKQLARLLDARMRGIAETVGNKAGEAQLLMFAALMLTDELQDTTRERDQLRDDIHNASRSFEQNKQIEIESAIVSTIHTIADRIESIAASLEGTS
jgi:cell division protein ZapA